MHKRIVPAVILAIVALTVAAWLVHNQFSSLQTQIAELQTQNSELQSQNSDLQNQTIWLQDQNRNLQEQISQLLEQYGENYSSPVKIVAFKWYGGFNPIVGVTRSPSQRDH